MKHTITFRLAGAFALFIGILWTSSVMVAAPAPSITFGKNEAGVSYPIQTVGGGGTWTITGAGGVSVPAPWTMPNKTVTFRVEDTTTGQIFTETGMATPPGGPSAWGEITKLNLPANHVYKVSASATFRDGVGTDHVYGTGDVTIPPPK